MVRRLGCCQSIVFVTCMMETLESTHERGRAGDGMISRHETCISEHDFRLIAGFGSRNLSAEVGTGTWQDANVSRTINPHDINRFLQYTLFQHHSEVTPVAYADDYTRGAIWASVTAIRCVFFAASRADLRGACCLGIPHHYPVTDPRGHAVDVCDRAGG